jgi:hypothetical protein
MAKITKREIKEGLEQIPIEQILLGSTSKRELTHKQKTFAKQVALGKPKTEAYRIAYDTEGKPSTQAVDAHNLSNHPNVSLMIEAYKRAFEAREYRNPERLRELVIHQLTEMALNPEVKDAQRIKSLELLGKVAEVGAFMDRKETKVIHESSKIKEKLLDQLKTIINIDAKEINSDDADELLREISGNRADMAAETESDPADPTTTRPPNIDHAEGGSPIHINPHIQSTPINTPPELTDSKEEKNKVETFPPDAPLKNVKEEGEGVANSWTPKKDETTETPPLTNPGGKG